MCNGYHHHKDCTCGFGGEGHKGKGNVINNIGLRNWMNNSTLLFEKELYETYTNPNAVCPVCGAIVFFYQSPDGGRVFFDELGPPWPKHPCTDNGQTPSFSQTPYIQSPKWMDDGWLPVKLRKMEKLTFYTLFEGRILKKDHRGKCQLYLIEEDFRLSRYHLCFIKYIDKNKIGLGAFDLRDFTASVFEGLTREGAIDKGLDYALPIEVGDELTVVHKGLKIASQIIFHPIRRRTRLICFIDNKNLKTESKMKIKSQPRQNFQIKARVISVDKSSINHKLEMIEI